MGYIIPREGHRGHREWGDAESGLMDEVASYTDELDRDRSWRAGVQGQWEGTARAEDPGLRSLQGGEVARIQDRPVRVREVMEVEAPDGSTPATINEAMITPLRERFSITTASGEPLEAQGNLVDHEYEISKGGDKIAEVSKE